MNVVGVGRLRSGKNPGLNPDSASETWHFERNARAIKKCRRDTFKTTLALSRLQRSSIQFIKSIANSIAQLVLREFESSYAAAAQQFPSSSAVVYIEVGFRPNHLAYQPRSWATEILSPL